jgi:hypothetical protein
MDNDLHPGGPALSEPDPPAEPVLEPDPATQPALSPLTRNLLFGLSLPERIVRSAVGLTAGTVKELAGFVVPQAFLRNRDYQLAHLPHRNGRRGAAGQGWDGRR